MKLHNWAREIKRPDEIVDYPVIRMALDSRLASLMEAILEDWDALEVVEFDGAIVVRVKEEARQNAREPVHMPKIEKTEKRPAPAAFGHVWPRNSPQYAP